MTKKKRKPWGLMGLLGLGGLLMMGSRSNDGPDDDEPDDDDPDDVDDVDDDGPIVVPPPKFPTEPSNDDPVVGPVPVIPAKPVPTKPTPKPTKPGTTDGPKPPIAGDDDPISVTPVFPTPGTTDPITVEPTFPTPTQDPPWTEIVDPYPRGGVFYQVVRDDRFGGTSSTRSIAYRYLLSEGYLAAVEVGGLDHEDAMAWAAGLAKQDKKRLEVIDLYQCSGWNDALYGTEPVQITHASANGRSIRLTPIHAPIATLLPEGETPVRNATMAGNPADGSLRKYELLWSPAIDRTTLWESGGQVVTTTGMSWPDGSSKENPPPWVMALGMDDLSGALEGSFGCPGTDGELEVG